MNRAIINTASVNSALIGGAERRMIKKNKNTFNPFLVDAWFMSGLSNSDKPTVLTGIKGNELITKNFAWSGMSGFGGYKHNTIVWTTEPTRAEKIVQEGNHYEFINIKENYSLVVVNGTLFSTLGNTIKVKIKGIPEGGTVYFGNPNYITATKDGIYEGAYQINPDNGLTNIGTTRCIGATIIVHFLPAEYEGALVFDGIDDYCKAINQPILTDYTIICRRVRQNNNYIASKSAIANKGAFIFEAINGTYSFASANEIVSPTEEVTYQTVTSYNGKVIIKGTAADTDSMWIGTVRDSDSRFFKGAIYYFALYDRTLTEEEIKKETDRLNVEWNKRLK